MKKNTFLLLLLCSSYFGFTQQTQYNIGFEAENNDGVINYWSTFESPNPIAQIIDNPDTDNGVVPITKVLQLELDQNSACYAGAINAHGTLGSWQLDSNVASNLTLSLSINSSIETGRIGIKMVNATDGTLFEISDAQGDYTGSGEWHTLTWDITAGANSGDNINVDQIVIFADWRCDGSGLPARPSDLTVLVDNITWGANKLTDAPGPSCTNGIEDGDETGVDCGGSCPDACIPDPPTSAPQLSSTGTDLIIYSDMAGDRVSDFIFNSFGGSGTYNEIAIDGDSNMTGKLFELDFFGSQWTPEDATTYTYVHLDYFATTASSFQFFLIDDSLSATVCCGNPAEPFYGFGPGSDAPLVQGQWTSVFIPLAHFTNFNAGWDGTDIKQTKFTGNGTIYFDNIFFSTENVLGVNTSLKNSFKVYPNPTQDNWELISSNTMITKVEVYDILGKKIRSTLSNSLNVLVNGEDLNSGVYFVKVYSGNETNVLRLIKK